MGTAPTSRLTPWVSRLLVLNAVVYIVLQTVLTAPAFLESLEFDPESFGRHPWSALTYLFVHPGIVHLGLTSLLLWAFGPPVERKLGSRAFILYYLYCGLGTALLAFGLSGFLPMPPVVGASGALFGIVLAFVLRWPETEIMLFPVPRPLSVRTLLTVMVGIDIIAAFWTKDGLAHSAHVGGVIAGYAFFRIQDLTARRAAVRPATVVRRPVVTPMRMQETAAELRPAIPHAETRIDYSDAEVDRVLDKIAQFGIQSLTSQERRFLSEVSEKKRREQH
jgi:membrane associated rhomboid family serine protease